MAENHKPKAKMTRPEALSLIYRSLDEIIPYLRELEHEAEHALSNKGLGVHEVGVSVGHTALRGEIVYAVVGRGSCSEWDIEDTIKSIRPHYKGICTLSNGTKPYPTHSVLNLQYLEDLRDAEF